MFNYNNIHVLEEKKEDQKETLKQDVKVFTEQMEINGNCQN